MLKKLTLLAMVVGAFAAFAIPAAASASKVTMPSGTLVPTGTELRGTANGTLFTETAFGTLECEKITIGAELTQNNGTTVGAAGLSGTTENCQVEGHSLSITNPQLKTLSSTETGKGTVSLAFGADIPSGPTCQFEGAGTFTYANPSSTITIAPTLLESAACGEAEIEGTVNIETTNGEAVILE